jgi:hypothetical protein
MSKWTLERYRAEVRRAKQEVAADPFAGMCVIRIGEDGELPKPLVEVTKLDENRHARRKAVKVTQYVDGSSEISCQTTQHPENLR